MRYKLLLIGIFLYLASAAIAQTEVSPKKDTSSAALKFLRDWEKDFLEAGMSMKNDSLQLNEEAKKLLLDSSYRKATYPVVYNWPEAIGLMNKMELKKAFWHIMNLYRVDTTHKELALQTFILYDSLVDMEKILVNTFYTYALTDPEISQFKNGKPTVTRPDILELKFNKMKEIINFLLYYRAQKEVATQKEKV